MGIALAIIAEEAVETLIDGISFRARIAAGMGNCPTGLISLFPRLGVCPVWRPDMITLRVGAQTVEPE